MKSRQIWTCVDLHHGEMEDHLCWSSGSLLYDRSLGRLEPRLISSVFKAVVTSPPFPARSVP